VILAVLASGWVTLVLLAPWLPVPLAGIVYLFGGRVCHQIAERSFFLDGAQLPVCARCLGTYAGAVVPLIYTNRARLAGGFRANPMRSLPQPALLGALALNGFTFAVEWSDLWHVSNAMRAAGGVALGVAVAFAIRQALQRRRSHDAHAEHERAPIQ